LSNFADTQSTLEEAVNFPDAFWQKVLAVKTAVNKELEVKRAEKVIGSGLSAEVDLYCDDDLAASLNSLGDELRFVLIVSRATVHLLENAPVDAVTTEVNGLSLTLSPSSFEKCERCWHHREDIGENTDHPKICYRCVKNIEGEGEQRQFA
jgi:isoleucyl-tRNA synthetase